jgi:3',5'-cyclic AMP phosphodiesterase CpdA
MKIILFADLHYFSGNIESAIFNTQKKLVRYSLPMLDRLTEIINDKYKADLAVNLGDVIQDTTEHDGDIEALKFIFKRLEAIKCPCVSVFGNHDLKMMDSVSEVEEAVGNSATSAIDLYGWHLVFLTTEVRPELGTTRGGCYKAQYLSDETLAWLDSDLSANKLPALIFTHFPLADDSSEDDECMFMKNRDEVKRIIRERGNVRAVFCGHRHITKTIIEDGIPHFHVGSMIGDLDLKGEPDGAYLKIDLSESTLAVTCQRISASELVMKNGEEKNGN